MWNGPFFQKHLNTSKWSREEGLKIIFLSILYLTLLAFRLKPHVWHSSYYVGFPFLSSGKKVVTCHDMISEIFKEDSHLKFLSLKKSDAILAISKNTESDLHRIWPTFNKKSQVVYNFVKKVEEGQKGKPPYFLYVGRRGGYKNFFPTIEEILQDGRFDEYHIHVVGGEKWSDEEKKLERNGRMKHFGTLSFEEVEMQIKGASLLLFPSLYEGFGMPIIEAFSAGIPVLAFNTSSIPEVVGPSYPLVEEKGVGDTMERLLKERERWGKYGKERAKFFNEENTLEKLYQFYMGA